MAYLDYPGLAYFKSLLDENYLRTNYEGDTVINGNVTFTEPVDASVKNDWLGQQIDKTYIKDVTPDSEGSGALALILGDGTVSHLITDTTVTQVRSSANELYPILLCYDASAEEDQIAKKVWYGNGVRINPRYGYLYSQKMFTLHPSYNRASAPTSRVEWANDFRDSVLNPVGQIFEYIDPVSSGGEHRMEFRLYGNPNVAGINTPNVNDETNTISMGVSATRGDILTFFGYCPSTPIYLEDGSTMRKSLTRGDQYGRDIITRDWLNLNGSITGLVHTYMDETIDGSKTFKKTVTINSGDNNNKAGLYVQGNSDIHGNEHVYGTETIDGKFTANGTAEIKGGSGNTPSLTVTGSEYVSGNSNIHGNMDVDGNSNTDGNQTVGGTSTITGKLTANGTAEIKGGSGNNPSLTVTGNEKVTGNSTVDGNSSVGGNSTITGSETVGGNISTTNGNISTTNGTISGKTGSIGSGGLTVTGNETVTGKITGNGGAEISGGSGLKVNGNETVTGNITTNGTITKVVNNTPVEYVTYVTNQPATREVISQNLLALGKGLAKDSSGKIYVDFSQIDTSTKNNILKGLSMQIPLTSNISLIVDKTNGSDVLEENRGSEAKPFKTIQACINFVTSEYAFNNHSCFIRVKANTYTETVTLPFFNRTTGTIYLQSYSGQKDVTIVNPEGSNRTLQCLGGSWYVSGFILKHQSISNTPSGGYIGIIVFCDNGGKLLLTGNTYENYYPSNFSDPGSTYHEIRHICSDNSSYVQLLYGTLPSNIISRTHSNVAINVLHPIRSGTIALLSYNGSDPSITNSIDCSGGCTVFAKAVSKGSIVPVDNGLNVTFPNSGFTGKRYACISGGTIQVRGDQWYFPGDSDGTVDSSTYSWYSD